LYDPQNRLIYLLGAEEAAADQAVVHKLCGLLAASFSPYVHLAGLPLQLHRAILASLPGGKPVISRVPGLPHAPEEVHDDQPLPRRETREAASQAPSHSVSVLQYLGLDDAEERAGSEAFEPVDEAAALAPLATSETHADEPDAVSSRGRKDASLTRWRKVSRRASNGGVTACPVIQTEKNPLAPGP
jgi:hypothetical protein